MPGNYSETMYLAWLASCHLPLPVMTELLNIYESAEELYTAFSEHSTDLFRAGIDTDVITAMKRKAGESELEHFCELIGKMSIRALTLKDTEYPELLKQISDPPAVLFYRGSLAPLKGDCVAMVGSRNASVKGMKVTGKIANELSKHGIAVVSGLADGIDSAAHRGCIDGGSPTIAILGCGSDRVYPASNQALADKIIECGGLILSEYAPGEKPLGWHFPIRNRIISGLSRATLMMECKIRSGSMSTVRHALDQGREVYAYPGEANSPWAEGAHQLLREGANYFSSAEDILDDLGYLDKPNRSVQNNVWRQEPVDLSPAQKKIVDVLKDGQLGFDELVVRTAMSSQELFTALTVLMIKGIVTAYPGKIYELTLM